MSIESHFANPATFAGRLATQPSPRPEVHRPATVRRQAKGAEAVEGTQEGILADVLGVLGAHDTRGDPHDDVAMALDELLEGAQIPLGRETHELRVSRHGRIGGLVRAHDRPDGGGNVWVTPIRTP